MTDLSNPQEDEDGDEDGQWWRETFEYDEEGVIFDED